MKAVTSLKYAKIQLISNKEIVQKVFSFFVKTTLVRRTLLIQNMSKLQKVQHYRHLFAKHRGQQNFIYQTDPYLFLEHPA